MEAPDFPGMEVRFRRVRPEDINAALAKRKGPVSPSGFFLAS
jgi:hypothetical protein